MCGLLHLAGAISSTRMIWMGLTDGEIMESLITEGLIVILDGTIGTTPGS